MKVADDWFPNPLSTFSASLTERITARGTGGHHPIAEILLSVGFHDLQLRCLFLCLPASVPVMAGSKVVSASGGFGFPHPLSPCQGR